MGIDFLLGFLAGGAFGIGASCLWYVNRIPKAMPIVSRETIEPTEKQSPTDDRFFKLVSQDSISYPYLYRDGECLFLPRKKYMLRFCRLQYPSRENWVGRAETYSKCLNTAIENKLVKESITGNGYAWAMDRGSRIAWCEQVYKDKEGYPKES